MLKVDVDCMVRDGKEAIVGGVVKQLPGHVDGLLLNQRAYIKVIENSENNGEVDFISNVAMGAGLNTDSSCKTVGVELFQLGENFNCMSPHVSVCSKHTDWEGCLERAKVEQTSSGFKTTQDHRMAPFCEEWGLNQQHFMGCICVCNTEMLERI